MKDSDSSSYFSHIYQLGRFRGKSMRPDQVHTARRQRDMEDHVEISSLEIEWSTGMLWRETANARQEQIWETEKEMPRKLANDDYDLFWN
jgi:hypothetical protein